MTKAIYPSILKNKTQYDLIRQIVRHKFNKNHQNWELILDADKTSIKRKPIHFFFTCLIQAYSGALLVKPNSGSQAGSDHLGPDKRSYYNHFPEFPRVSP